jgi:hypothetical protein
MRRHLWSGTRELANPLATRDSGATTVGLKRSNSVNSGTMKGKKDMLDVEKDGSAAGTSVETADTPQWGRKMYVTLALTILTSSQGLLIAMSKANDIKYDYSYTSANCTVEFVKCVISFIALSQVRSLFGPRIYGSKS